MANTVTYFLSQLPTSNKYCFYAAINISKLFGVNTKKMKNIAALYNLFTVVFQKTKYTFLMYNEVVF